MRTAAEDRGRSISRSARMLGTHWRPQIGFALVPFVTAWGSSLKTQGPVVTPAPAAVAQAHADSVPPPSVAKPPVEDPVLTLIATSDGHFKAGQREPEQGHVEAAKQEFNRAIDVLLESPYGARTEPRVREHFDRLVDRISTYEVRALAAGDGFTEKKYEPAPIGDLLALSATFGAPPAAPQTKEALHSDRPKAVSHSPHPRNQRVLSYIELFQG